MKPSNVTPFGSTSAAPASALACKAHKGAPSSPAAAVTSQPGKRHQPDDGALRRALIEASSSATGSGSASSGEWYPFEKNPPATTAHLGHSAHWACSARTDVDRRTN